MASTAVPSFETIRSILGAMGLRLAVEPAEGESA
jgi:DNA-binding phage protein